MKPKKRSVRKGTFDVGVDDHNLAVEGKEVTKTKKNKTVVKFKARGLGKKNPIKRISDKLVTKNGYTKTNKKKTVFKTFK